MSGKWFETWRNAIAIWGAVAIGAFAGVFLRATAAPFGPVLFGWLVVLAGSVVVPGGLCFLATHRYILVRFAYAGGVAIGVVATGLAFSRGDPEISFAPLQFVLVFGVVCSVSLVATGLWTVIRLALNWAEERFREWEGPIE